MACRRCSICALNYPTLSQYATCLRCGEGTDNIANDNPMPAADLEALKVEVAEVAARSEGTEEQWLVSYYDKTAQNPNGEYRSEVFFATAYGIEHAKEMMTLCRRVHGDDSGVRSFVARARPPQDNNPVAVGTRT